MKLYSISHDASEIDWSLFEPEIRRGLGSLPRPSVAPGRPGVGFVIAHHGRTADYLERRTLPGPPAPGGGGPARSQGSKRGGASIH
jgi:hypothetical protein